MPKLEPTSGQASKAVVILKGIFPVISKHVSEIYFCGRRRLTCIHTIIEWFGFEGALKIIQLRTLCHGQAHLPLHQIAQNEQWFSVLKHRDMDVLGKESKADDCRDVVCSGEMLHVCRELPLVCSVLLVCPAVRLDMWGALDFGHCDHEVWD